SRRRHTRSKRDWSSDVCSSDLQLDVFGEVMDALHQGRCSGLAVSESGWAVQQALLSYLERIWSEPDEGIWEVRGGRKHFTYSKRSEERRVGKERRHRRARSH